MSSALSEQSCVHKGVDYDEVFLSGQNDLGTSSDERNPLATSPSIRDEDLDKNRLVSDSTNGLDGAEPPIQSIVGPDGFREFIMLSMWIVNDFISSIKQAHFNTLREKYRIPVHIPIHLPYKSKKCYYKGVNDVGVYKQMLKVGLRFPLNAFHCCFLQYLGLAFTQISLNAWRVFLRVEVLYGVMSDEACRLIVEEFFHCYHLSEILQSNGMYSFVPRSPLLRLVSDTLNFNRNWKSRYFFIQGDE